MDWYPWYFTIYEADTIGLNPYQDGCYRRLIDFYMRTRAPIPDDDAALAGIVRDSLENWMGFASDRVRKFFKARNGKLYNKRCDIELATQDALTKKLSESGKNGAEKRWNKNKDIVNEAIAPPLEPPIGFYSTGQDIDSTGSKNTDPSVKTPFVEKQVFDDVADDFNNLWVKFPKTRPGSKAKGLAAYRKARTRATREEIQNGLESYRGCDEVQRGFAKGAAAWLNDDRWTSDYGTKPAGHQNQQPKAGYLDKVAASAKRASELIAARVEADRDQPWSLRPDATPRIGSDDPGGKSAGVPQIPHRTEIQIPGAADRNGDEEGFDGCSDDEE